MNTRLVKNAADVIARAMQQGRTLPATLAVALDSAQLLQSPARAAEHKRLLDRVAELETQIAEYERPVDEDPIPYALAEPVTVYRAEHPDSGITLGHYTTEVLARAHCEAMLRRELPGAAADWIADDEEEGALAELVAAVGDEERPTGYLVTPIEIATAYDEEADE